MRRVAIYARVSTEHEAQISALSNQIQYYDDIIMEELCFTDEELDLNVINNS